MVCSSSLFLPTLYLLYESVVLPPVASVDAQYIHDNVDRLFEKLRAGQAVGDDVREYDGVLRKEVGGDVDVVDPALEAHEDAGLDEDVGGVRARGAMEVIDYLRGRGRQLTQKLATENKRMDDDAEKEFEDDDCRERAVMLVGRSVQES